MQHQLFAHEEWLALAFDMDGCIYSNKYLACREKKLDRRNNNPLSYAEESDLLIGFNIVLLQSMINRVKGKYSRVYILSGSRRQDYATDELNNRMNQSLSSLIALQILRDYFKTNLPDQHVELITFFMADLEVCDKPSLQHVGSAFQSALDKMQNNSDTPQPDWNGLEEYKLTICYSHSHLLMQIAEAIQKQPTIHYCLIDDRQDILRYLDSFVSCYPLHFPKNIHYQFLEYSVEAVDQNFACLGTLCRTQRRGTGTINPNFMQTIKGLQNDHATDCDTPVRNYRCLTFKTPAEADQLLATYRQIRYSICTIL